MAVGAGVNGSDGGEIVQEQAAVLGSAWHEYAAALTSADEAIRSNESFSEDTAVNAYAYLAGLVERYHDLVLRAGDPRYPRWVRGGATPGRDAMNPNADTFYLYAPVKGSESYRIFGRLGSVTQTIIGSYLPRIPGDTSLSGAHDRLTAEDLKVGRDGSIEIAVGPERPPNTDNWLATSADVDQLKIYEVYGDWEHEQRGTFTIHHEPSLGRRRGDPTAEELAERIRRVPAAAVRLASYWQQASRGVAGRTTPNAFTELVHPQIAMLGALFSKCVWELHDAEALIIEARPPEDSRYWGWSACSLFGTTLDYANRQTSLNHTQAGVDEDGVVRLVLTAQDPGVQNWIDVGGHPVGQLTWRVSTPTAPSTPTTRVVPFDDVRLHLPAATRRVTSSERSSEITRRQRQIARRYAE